MKTFLLVLLSSFTASSAWACPNFSGTYSLEGGKFSPVKITQDACATLTMTVTSEHGTFETVLITDGQTHVTEDDADFFHKYQMTWTEAGLSSRTETLFRQPDTKEIAVGFSKLNAQGNLEIHTETTYYPGGNTERKVEIWRRQ